MPPVVHCVRHAQGVHNLSRANHNIRDPFLTRHGEEQCRNLAQIFPYHHQIDMLCSSPLTRTLQTALLAFDTDIRRAGLVIHALPDAQETSNLPCDTGKDPGELRQMLAGKPVDLALVHEGWNSKQGRYAENADSVRARARDLRVWLRGRPEREIVLVTHGGFLHYLTKDWDGWQEPGTTGWANAEFRSYEFKDDGDDTHLVEMLASKRLRKGQDRPLGETEQLELERSMDSKGKSKNDRDWVGGYTL